MGGSGAPAALDAMDRVLDPLVLSQVSAGRNVTVTNSTLSSFNQLWQEVNSRRVALHRNGTGKNGNPDAMPHSAQFEAWWRKLGATMPAALRVGSLRHGDCGDVNGCIGRDHGGEGNCVCNQA